MNDPLSLSFPIFSFGRQPQERWKLSCLEAFGGQVFLSLIISQYL